MAMKMSVGHGNDEFLARFVRHSLEAGKPADRQQGHVGRAYPEIAGREDMTKLVKHDAEEHGEDEEHPVHAAWDPPIW